ncbi:AEC family transporter [Propionivibrio sp.]|uniref:AEC family transporter n=1 Tax=Propionivibrio sp. TaxID=2212460 RepID=UPI0039E5844C
MLYRIVSIVFPLFAVVMAGYLYARKRGSDMAAANRMNMEVFLPALIFTALAGKSFNLADNLPIAIGCTVVVVGSGMLAWPVARLLRIDPRTLVPTAMFNNVGNMGLPLMLFTFGDQALGAAVVMMLILTVMQFSLSPWLLGNRVSLAAMWREPFLIAAALGVTVSLSGVALWPPVLSACKLLADISLGLMIFSLGVRLASTWVGTMLGIGTVGAIVTPVTGMLLAWAFGLLAGLSKPDMDILFLFGALPPAVSCFIFADRYRCEPDKVAAIVMIGNASALFFIPLALALRL